MILKLINLIIEHPLSRQRKQIVHLDNLAISVQQKTVQEVVASTAKVLLHDERIEPASVEIQMRINNIKGHTRGKAANVHFDAFVRQLLHVLTTITKSALIQKL